MIVDASALLAIIFREPEREIFAQAIARSDAPSISVINYWEVAAKVDRSPFPETGTLLLDFMRIGRMTVEPVTRNQGELAREAFRNFGKGRHKAGLNMGDCFAYALAVERNRPLLYKGNDFSQTDLESAL